MCLVHLVLAQDLLKGSIVFVFFFAVQWFDVMSYEDYIYGLAFCLFTQILGKAKSLGFNGKNPPNWAFNYLNSSECNMTQSITDMILLFNEAQQLEALLNTLPNVSFGRRMDQTVFTHQRSPWLTGSMHNIEWTQQGNRQTV